MMIELHRQMVPIPTKMALLSDRNDADAGPGVVRVLIGIQWI